MIISYSITRSLVVLELVLPLNHAKTTELCYCYQFCVRFPGLTDAEVATYLLSSQKLNSWSASDLRLLWAASLETWQPRRGLTKLFSSRSVLPADEGSCHRRRFCKYSSRGMCTKLTFIV